MFTASLNNDEELGIHVTKKNRFLSRQITGNRITTVAGIVFADHDYIAAHMIRNSMLNQTEKSPYASMFSNMEAFF